MTTLDPSLRVGCIGLGAMGVRLCGQANDHPSIALTAIADPNETVLAQAGADLSVPSDARYTDPIAMLDAARLDAVFIVSPQGLHFDQLTAALDRDLHVLCEKPLVTTLRDAKRITQRVEASDQTVLLGYQRHLDPAFRRVKARWGGTNLKPRFVTGEIAQDWRHYFETGTNWRTNPELSGGGHLFNVGTHVIDAVLWTTGLTPTHVTATMDFHDEDRRIDRQSSLILEFENGTMASISDTGLASTMFEHFHAWDDDGALAVTARNWGDWELTSIDADGTERDIDVADEPQRAPNKVEAFVDAISTGEEPPCTVRDGLRATAVLEAAYESARTGERTAIDL